METLDFTSGNSFDETTLDLQEDEFEDYSKFQEFVREKYFYVDNNSKEKEYFVGSNIKAVHWGQLKLFLSEFFVFIYHLDDDVKDVLYIGAANGSHIVVLSDLFPDITFHLYDSGTFDKRLYKLKNIKIIKKYFSNEELEKWKKINKKIFLISDIRSLNYSSHSMKVNKTIENENSVWGDMKLQEKWVEALNPAVSLLKFRLPFAYDFELKKGKTRKYLDGKVCFQVYNKPTSSETRLLIKKGISYKNWDILEYERKLFYHNSVTRNKIKFINPINGKKEEIYPEMGLFNDFDSTYFTVLVIDFLRKKDEDLSLKNVKKFLNKIINNINPWNVNLNHRRAGF